MLFRAIEFAAHAHAGQFRKLSPLPYIYHPLAVARILIEHGCAEPVVVAGLLHDTVEDTPVTLSELRDTFGEEVATLVAGASEPDKRAPWEARKWHTLHTLEEAPEGVLLVVCADKLDNVRSIQEERAARGESVWHSFNRPAPFQRWYYHAVLAALARRAASEPLCTLVATLAEAVHPLFGAPPQPHELPPSLREAPRFPPATS